MLKNSEGAFTHQFLKIYNSSALVWCQEKYETIEKVNYITSEKQTVWQHFWMCVKHSAMSG